MASETVGLGPCVNCDATVAYKQDKNGRLHYRCTGQNDPGRRACGMAVLYFGEADSEKLKKTFKEKNDAAVKGRVDDIIEPKRAEPAKVRKRAVAGTGDGSGDGDGGERSPLYTG
ncbi:hypothetical protein [Parvibaculum sp.]|uniref:hypothetical protein n=1 Tax=Parvibaculum sp. TaxID=2024848 RepID=UPI00260AB60B|nr:hypothetical protein [Parvibaculum sp.]MCW5728145.1 hypothetical protein [Parvibaculum sp.]